MSQGSGRPLPTDHSCQIPKAVRPTHSKRQGECMYNYSPIFFIIFIKLMILSNPNHFSMVSPVNRTGNKVSALRIIHNGDRANCK